jgi:hypothetical protein
MENRLALAVLGFLGVCAFIVLSNILSGWALVIMWGWFVVPIFGLPKLSVVSAMGVSLVVSYLTHQLDFKKGEEEDWSTKISLCVLKPIMFLGVGLIIRQYM